MRRWVGLEIDLAAIVMLCLSVGVVLILIPSGLRPFPASDPERLAREAATCTRGAPAADVQVHASR
jgi:hypothetical protein